MYLAFFMQKTGCASTKIEVFGRSGGGACMERTISMMVGKGSLNHNNRTFIAKNVDRERSKGNKVYVKENIKKVYHSLFDGKLLHGQRLWVL